MANATITATHLAARVQDQAPRGARTKLATPVSKRIPAEHGFSAAMVSGEIAIAAPATTVTGAIIVTREGATPTGVSVVERKRGFSFKLKRRRAAPTTSTGRFRPNEQ